VLGIFLQNEKRKKRGTKGRNEKDEGKQNDRESEECSSESLHCDPMVLL